MQQLHTCPSSGCLPVWIASTAHRAKVSFFADFSRYLLLQQGRETWVCMDFCLTGFWLVLLAVSLITSPLRVPLLSRSPEFKHQPFISTGVNIIYSLSYGGMELLRVSTEEMWWQKTFFLHRKPGFDIFSGSNICLIQIQNQICYYTCSSKEKWKYQK